MTSKAQVFTIPSLVIAFAFAAISLLLYPLWEDINNFLSTKFPVMLSATMLGGLCFAGLLYLLETNTFGQRWHYILFSIADIIMVVLLAYLVHELGTERTVLVRQAITLLPYILWFGLIVLYLWFMPRSIVLQSRPAMVGLMVFFAASALVWFSLPLQIKLSSRPVVFIQTGGVVVSWGTNMTATGEVEYSLDGQPSQIITSQTHGLRDLGDQIVRIFLPLSPAPVSLNLTVTSEGVKAVHPTNVIKAGSVASENITIPFPAAGNEISFVSFSDLHEQTDVYEQLAAHVPWDEINLAVYNGDFLNSTVSPEQVTRSILDLPTGNRDLPRVFVRGNHETRNKSARLLGDWLLPDGGHWYQAFTFGNTFFIALDGGEDKPDTDKEYGGLVDFSTYHQEQAKWLEKVLGSPEFQQAQYRVVLLHIPIF